MTPQPDLSVIVPFYNEEDNIQRMHAAIVAAVRDVSGERVGAEDLFDLSARRKAS